MSSSSRVLAGTLSSVLLVASPVLSAPAAKPAASHGIDVAGMDRAVKPGDNFFEYANGSWWKKTTIPADHASYGSFSKLTDLANQRMVALIKATAQKRAPAGSEAQKIADYYASYLDAATIEKKGLGPLKPTLEGIAAIANAKDLARVLGSQLRADVDPLNATDFHTDHLFGLWVSLDLNNPQRYVPYVLQGGLGLPDRDYYLSPDARMAEIRTKYQAHIAAMLKLAGIQDAAAKAQNIFGLEKIAQGHGSRLDSEDVLKANNPWKRAQFSARAPGLDWDAYFQAAGLSGQEDFIVWQPGAVTALSALVKSEPLGVWKDYLTFRAIAHNAAVLPKAFVDEQFALYGKVLSGVPQQRPRWKRAVSATNAALGQAVGHLYVDRYFPAEAKAKAEEMVQQIVSAYGKRIDALTWMAPTTKAKAKEKLATLKVCVGYPDVWRDFSGLKVVRGDAFGNAERASLFEYQRNLKKLSSKVDRGEWSMDPQEVNAVNMPIQNALDFPAAILQPPFFDAKADAAQNFGAIGSVIGHEISHSFDDQGSQFDAQGKLSNWWTKEDLAHFKAASARLAAQFDAYQPFPGTHVNGKLTLSENIADVAGLSASLDGYHTSLQGKPSPKLQGFTGDQRFFISFGQAWRLKVREAALRSQLLTDGHAPAEYRADTVRNLDAWYAAFDVKPTEKLYLAPADRVQVW